MNQAIATPTTERPRYIGRAEVLEITGFGETWLRTLLKRKQFPAPIRLGPPPNGRLRWTEREVFDWMESKREEGAGGEVDSENADVAENAA